MAALVNFGGRANALPVVFDCTKIIDHVILCIIFLPYLRLSFGINDYRAYKKNCNRYFYLRYQEYS